MTAFLSILMFLGLSLRLSCFNGALCVNRVFSQLANIKDTGLMKDTMRRTANIRGDLRRRTTVLRTLQLMVMNGVVRRAEAGCVADRVDYEKYSAAPVSSLPSVTHEPAWFARFFRRRGESPVRRERDRI